jgi:hypothetical protein
MAHPVMVDPEYISSQNPSKLLWLAVIKIHRLNQSLNAFPIGLSECPVGAKRINGIVKVPPPANFSEAFYLRKPMVYDTWLVFFRLLGDLRNLL